MNMKKMLITGAIVASLGTTTAAYAATTHSTDKPAAPSSMQQPPFGHHGHGMRGGGLMKDAASILKVDQKTLMSDLKAGKSLADIASSKGISKDTLISKLNASMKTRLDKAVSNGKLTAAKEKDILTKSQTRLTKMVEQKGLPKFGGKHGMHGMRGGGLMKDAASILKVDQKTLIERLESWQISG